MNYTDDDLTPWFDGKLYKPARPGPYMLLSGSRGAIGYQMWDGHKFGHWFESLHDAVWRSRDGDCAVTQNDNWRGLRRKL